MKTGDGQVKKPKYVVSALLALGFLTHVSVAGLQEEKTDSRFTLWQLPSQSSVQMMSYVIQSSGGKLIVIDGGNTVDGPYLKGFIAGRGNRVEHWFITHPHADHVGALTWILSNQGALEINEIDASFPPLDWIEKNYDPNAAGGFQGFTNALADVGINYTDLTVGGIFDVNEIHIEILALENTNITHNAANNSSLLMRVSDPSKSILFTGDLGPLGGDKIVATVDHRKLKADYVQMPHHGQACAKKDFYCIVQPKYALWPTPLWLWNNDNGGGYDSGSWGTLTTRQWMEDLNIKSNYVSGVVGLVEIK